MLAGFIGCSFTASLVEQNRQYSNLSNFWNSEKHFPVTRQVHILSNFIQYVIEKGKSETNNKFLGDLMKQTLDFCSLIFM